MQQKLCDYPLAQESIKICLLKYFNDDSSLEALLKNLDNALVSFEYDEIHIEYKLEFNHNIDLKEEKYFTYNNNFCFMVHQLFSNVIHIVFLTHNLFFLERELKGIKQDISNKQIKDFIDNNTLFTFNALEKCDLTELEKVRDTIFPNISKKEKDTLKASLYPHKFYHVYQMNNLKNLKYFVVKEKSTNKIVGISGIYEELNDADSECWLGWFGVDENSRNKGLGKYVLSSTIQMVKQQNKKILKLYTYDSEEFQAAYKLYKNFGFEEFHPAYKKYKKDIFLKLAL